MKKIIYVIIFLMINLQVVHSQSQNISFMGKYITFGSSSVDFISANSDYQLYNEENRYEGIKAYHKNIEGKTENGNGYWFRINFKFYNDKLFEMEINEYWTPDEYMKIIQQLIRQFKILKEEENDDEGGWYKQYLEKGMLTAIYGGGGEGSYFKCNETGLLIEVRKKYPDYGK